MNETVVEPSLNARQPSVRKPPDENVAAPPDITPPLRQHRNRDKTELAMCGSRVQNLHNRNRVQQTNQKFQAPSTVSVNWLTLSMVGLPISHSPNTC